MTHLPSGGVILFGGEGVTGGLGDTWLYASGVWTELTLSLPVSPQVGACSGASGPIWTDPMVVSGNELWQWNGAWNLLSNAVPVESATVGITGNGEAIVSGGTSPALTAWRFRAGQWIREGTTEVTPLSIALDPADGRVLGLGGELYQWTDTPPEEEPLGVGCGQPRPELVGVGQPWLGNGEYSLDAFVASTAPVVFALDTAFVATAPGSCAPGLPAPGFARIAAANAFGRANLPLPIPRDAALRGFTFFAQAAALQTGGPLAGFALTPGLRIRIGG